MSLEYASTRGVSSTISAEGVIFTGWAPDGGLYVPTTLPTVDWRSWRRLDYKAIVANLLKAFLPDVKDVDYDAVVGDVFEASGLFPYPSPIHLHQLDGDQKSGAVSVVELFHGPTWAFKDYSMLVLAALMQTVLQRRRQRRTMLVATSGDTGAAAMAAIRGKANLDLIVLVPYARCSRIQERMMLTVDEPNIHVFHVDGTSDELDSVLSPIFADEHYVAEHQLGSANSINWIRVLVQAAHWFYAYFKLTADNEEQLRVFVPTGACGSLAGGVYAKELGLPVQITACTGPNDAVFNFVRTGSTKMPVKASLATAMDIQVPYNLERILFVLSNGDQSLIAKCMSDYERNGSMEIRKSLLTKLQAAVDVRTVGDATIASTMKQCVDRYHYYCCPHTATAIAHAWEEGHQTAERKTAVAYIATASPQKFHDTFEKIGMRPPEQCSALKALLQKPVVPPVFLSRDTMADWNKAVRLKILQISEKHR